jgi:hypothetical protein
VGLNFDTTDASAARALRAELADWGPGGATRTNELVTVDTLSVLRAAGRMTRVP